VAAGRHAWPDIVWLGFPQEPRRLTGLEDSLSEKCHKCKSLAKYANNPEANRVADVSSSSPSRSSSSRSSNPDIDLEA